MKKHTILRPCFWLAILLLLTVIGPGDCSAGTSAANGSGNAVGTASETTAVLDTPQWAAGDSWQVETEIYEQGRTMAGLGKQGWRAAGAWLFTVEDIEAIGGERFFVLSVEPLDGNPCPYLFTLWLRTGDLTIHALALEYLLVENKSARIPSGTVKKFDTGGEDPDYWIEFFKIRFPTFPMWLLPRFKQMQALDSDDADRVPQRLHGRSSRLRQHIRLHRGPLPEMPAPPWDHLTTTDGTDARTDVFTEVCLDFNGATEVQYWHDALPWPVAGRRGGAGTTAKRYRLISASPATGCNGDPAK